MGPYFEDFAPGQVFRHWPGRTITEADDTFFCMMTMNHNPLHFDAHYAAKRQHGQRVVVGTLVFSLAVGMSVRDISLNAVANLDYEEVRHVAPVFHGDTIYAQSEILEVRPSRSKPDRGIVHLRTTATNQDGQVVLTFRRHVMIPRRPPESDRGND
jgi:acyl dehydratase